ncbi:MAG: hypothetical protein ACE5Z5_15510, partial [Candidatus Bathyarchaeia archaeon]
DIHLGFEVGTAMELAYFAGLFDGEGSIQITKETHRDDHHRNPVYCLRIDLSLIHRSPILRLKGFFKAGWISRRVHNYKGRVVWYWGAKGEQACRVLEALLPYLHIKKPQAEIGIAFHRGKTVPRNRRLNGEDLHFREMMRETLREERAILV